MKILFAYTFIEVLILYDKANYALYLFIFFLAKYKACVGGKIVRFSSHYIINTRAFPKCRNFLVSRFLLLSSRLLPFTRRSTDLITMTSLSQRRFYLATRNVRLRLKSII